MTNKSPYQKKKRGLYFLQPAIELKHFVTRKSLFHNHLLSIGNLLKKVADVHYSKWLKVKPLFFRAKKQEKRDLFFSNIISKFAFVEVMLNQ